MSGINTGILHNAEPLSVDAIKALEKKILEDNKTYAYLDQAGELCFAMQRGVDGIKDLAWNNAYELTNAGSILTKKAYKKTGLKTFVLDSTYTKPSLNASWTVGEIPIFEFDGSIEGRPYVYSDRHDAMLVKVSDSVLTSQMLLGSTLTYITGEHGADVENTVLLDNTEYVHSIIGDNGTEEGCLVETMDWCHIVSVSNSWLLPDFFDWDIQLEPGTYFMVYSSEAAEEGGFSKVYTKSISCLTIADATNPTTATVERLEGDGQEFYTTAPSTLSFRSTAPLSEFQDVQINGQTIDPSNYTLEEGSTIVKLSHEYLKTLDVGSYELSVISDSKTAKGDFTVAAPELNEYGFYYNQPYSCEDIQVGEGLNECLINGAIVFNPDGTAYELNFEVPNCINTTLEHLEDGLYKFYLCGARITGRFSADGKTFIGTETFLEGDGDFIKDYIGPGINLALNTDVVAADDNGFYKNTYLNSSYDGMTMWPKPNNKQNYDNIRDNIDGIPVTTMASFGQSEVKNIVIPASILYINQSAFSCCENLENVTIPNSVVAIGVNAFWYCNKLYNIIFNGTVAQWNTINKGDSWHDHVPATYVQCSDGRAPL